MNAEGGQRLYRQEDFPGAELKFLKCKSENKLSIIDWMMMNSREEIRAELKNFELV